MAYSNSYMLFLLGVSLIISSQVLAYNRPSKSSLSYGEALDEQKGLDYVNAPKMYEELEAKKDMDYVKAPKIVSYEMPHEHPTYVAYEMPLEHTSSDINDGGLDYIKAPRTHEMIEEGRNDVDYVKTPKNIAYEMPLEHTSYSDTNDEKFDDQKVLDFVKSPKTAAYEMPPESPTYSEINANLDEVLNDQKSVGSIKAQENDEKLDDQKSMDSMKAPQIDEKFDDQKGIDSMETPKSDETLNGQKGVEWISFHAKYPWIKKNSFTTGSRKLLLNHNANGQSA
uniref:Late nodulin Nvf-30b n=1 Tax=Vicia faba TaxID=3906 RepID=Q7DLJ2_VICFA|nr:late nodulin Nvf-30b [Vicia faba]